MNDTVVFSIFVGMEGFHSFSAFLPSYFTIKQFANDQAAIDRIRSGYVPALGVNTLLGLVVWRLTGSLLPLLFSAVGSGLMILLYERAIGEAKR